MGRYDTAQICLNGHVVNDMCNTFPEENQSFCEKCGAETITKCLKCSSFIKGDYVPDHNDAVLVIPGAEYKRPLFCIKCGKAYPWTEEKIKAAKELALEIENLSDTEKAALSNSIDDLVAETPRTQLAITRFKKLMIKAGEQAAGFFKDVLKDVISESVRKALWGQ